MVKVHLQMLLFLPMSFVFIFEICQTVVFCHSQFIH